MRKIETRKGKRGTSYYVRFRLAGKQTSESFDTKREAEQFAKWLDALGPQGAVDQLYEAEQIAQMPTLDEVAADYFANLEAADGHRAKQARLWKRTWGPRIGEIRADQITRDHLVAAFRDLARNGRSTDAGARGYSEKSLKNQRGLLHGVLQRAVDDGYLETHPGRRLRLPIVTVEVHEDYDDAEEMICLTREDFDLIYSAMTPHYRPLTRFLAGTGARWGEAVALRVDDYNRLDRTIRIRRALKDTGEGRFVIGPPKTKKSKRTIKLGATIIGDLERLLEGKGPKDLIFTAPRGGMIRHRTFWSDHWRPALWRAQHCPRHTDERCRCGTAHPKRCTVHTVTPPPCGCPGTLGQSPRIHDLRHSHVAWLLGNGTDIYVVQARLGHESITTTVDTYGFLLPDAQEKAARAAELVFEVTTPRHPVEVDTVPGVVLTTDRNHTPDRKAGEETQS